MLRIRKSDASPGRQLATAGVCAPPLVTVAIPFYNGHAFLNECLASLARQSFRNFEVVVFDDGSEPPLDISQVPAAAGFPPERIRLLRGAENRGPAFARNRILETAQGRYVAFQDADDVSEPDRLAMLIEELRRDPELIAVGSGVLFVDAQGARLRKERFPRDAITEGGFNGCCGSFIYDRERAPELRFDERLRAASEDVEFLFRLEQYGSVRNIPGALYRYRVHPKSLTAGSAWLAAHTSYMWREFARRKGVFGEDGLSPDRLVDLILSADGTQTAELLLTHGYRRWRSHAIGAMQFAALARIFPRSAMRVLHQHLLMALESTFGRRS